MVDGPTRIDNCIEASVILTHEVPALLPIEGAAVGVRYAGMTMQCFNCFKRGHMKVNCTNPKVSWLAYLHRLQGQFNIPHNYFKELRDETMERSSSLFPPRSGGHFRTFFT